MEQLKSIFRQNRANCDTSTKFGTVILMGILYIFQDGRQIDLLKVFFPWNCLYLFDFDDFSINSNVLGDAEFNYFGLNILLLIFCSVWE